MFDYCYFDPIFDFIPEKPKEFSNEDIVWHHQHASIALNQEALVFEAICLSHRPLKRANAAEYHPAIVLLCKFWEHLHEEGGYFSPAVPVIQIFVGNRQYVPLIPSLPSPHDVYLMQPFHKEATVSFNHQFLVTYLASRQHSEKLIYEHYWLHYTIYDEAYLIEENPAPGKSNCLAWHTLQGLRHFKTNFPMIWQDLQRKYGGK